jgi:hypothetical protein
MHPDFGHSVPEILNHGGEPDLALPLPIPPAPSPRRHVTLITLRAPPSIAGTCRARDFPGPGNRHHVGVMSHGTFTPLRVPLGILSLHAQAIAW